MGRRYARGKKAVAICQRGGHKIPYKRLVVEPGTGYLVDKRWSDGRWNLVDHPQNYPPRNLSDERPLRHPTDETSIKTTSVIVIPSVVPPVSATISIANSSVTVVPILNFDGCVLLTEASVTIVEQFSLMQFISLGSPICP